MHCCINWLDLPFISFRKEEVFGVLGHEKVENFRASEMLMLSVNSSTTVGTIKKVKQNKIELALKIPIVPIQGESVGIARNLHGH